MRTLKMVVIGAGQIVKMNHLPNYLSMNCVKIVGISDTNILAAKSVAEKFSIPTYFGNHKQMLEELKPDAATICVPNRCILQLCGDR
ncbi:MAG: Gfo/Idh/MocA family oxidoreductase [Eubacteriales bacterium]|nr:Gfo/Idh/MocA family oxidoreductase [Eubacteriales bacterium]